MFFVVVGTHTKCVINEFALDARIDILIFQCHTVTNGIDLRRSPHWKIQSMFAKYDIRRKLCQMQTLIYFLTCRDRLIYRIHFFMFL